MADLRFGSRGGGSGYSAAYGGIPDIPMPESTAAGATSEAMKLGNNVFGQLPGYKNSLANIGQNVEAYTAGQVPADVIQQLQQQAAERGIATGTQGSQNTNASYLKALGLTSLDLTQKGQGMLNEQLKMLPGYQQYQNPNFYVSAALRHQAATDRAIFASAPNPAAAASAALGAAQSGYGAGKSSMGSPPQSGGQPYGVKSGYGFHDNYGTESANSLGTGTYINGQYYEAGQGPLSQNSVDKILHQYDPSGSSSSGGGSPALTGDPETDYFNNQYGTPVSDTAPAGTSSGFYYAGDAAGEQFTPNYDDWLYGDLSDYGDF